MNAPAGTPYLRPGVITAVLTTALGVTTGTVLALLAGVAAAPALRTGAVGWLVTVGGGLEVDGVAVTVLPIGGLLLAAGLTALVAARVVREPLDGPGPFAATVAGTAGILAAVLASVAGLGAGVAVNPVRAALAAFVVAGLGAALGAVLPHGAAEQLWPSSRDDVRSVLRAARLGVLGVLVPAAVLVLVLLVRHVDRAADLWAVLDPGVGGGVALAVVCLLAVPSLVLWAASVLIGPGFVLGADTSVDLAGAQLAAVPGLPVLAALPAPGAFPGAVVVLGLVPVLAGAWAGWSVRAPAGATAWVRIGLGAAAGGVAGLVCGVLVGVSGGALGPGRMAEVGPPVLWPLLVAVPVLAAGGAVGAALAHYRGAREQPRDERAPRRPRLRLRHQPAGLDRRDDGPVDGS